MKLYQFQRKKMYFHEENRYEMKNPSNVYTKTEIILQRAYARSRSKKTKTMF